MSGATFLLPYAFMVLPNERDVKEGYAMAQLVEALRYNPEGRGFDSR
jgi:hypothetical protein